MSAEYKQFSFSLFIIVETSMIRLLLVVFLFSSFAVSAFAAESVRVPDGKHVMPDGKCETYEWRDAFEKTVNDKYKLLFKKSADYVYICIKPTKEATFWVDLYVAPADKKLYTLHASAKLGERVLEGDKWKEFTTDWAWWNINGWWANSLRMTNGREYLPHQAIEFQIGRARFAGREWYVMLEIEGRANVFPANADNLKTETWMKFDLNK